MTKIRGMLSSVLLTSLAVCACGSDSVPLSNLATKVTDTSCARLSRCGAFPDEASCKASVILDYNQLEADVSSGKIKYDGDAAASCLNGLDSSKTYESCSITDSATTVSPKACAGTFKGTVATGGACVINDECVSGACDASACTNNTALCCAGTCLPTAAQDIPVGGDCSAAAAQCVSSAYCKLPQNGGPPACAARLAVGAACDALNGLDQCVSGALCLFLQPPTSAASVGACGRLPTQGQACNANVPCDSYGLFCDQASSTCLPRIALGGACDPKNDGCVLYASCNPATLKCAAAGKPGEACDANVGLPCLGDLNCTGAVCVPPIPQPACP